MTVPGSANPLLLRSAAPAAYQISRSLRFNSSDSAYLSRVVGGSATTFTISCWVKLGKLTGLQTLFGFGADTYSDTLFLTGDGRVSLYNGSSTGHTYSTALLRDPSAWYHFLVKVTSGNPVLYVNGSLFVSASGYNWQMHGTNNRIGAFNESGTPQYFFDGYIADFYCIENQALDPSSFTETSATTGQLIPKAYTGTFGTNGFWLKFSDNSNNTAATLGKDYSPNGNNWTPNNLSVTAGAGNDSLVDTPTSYGTDTGAGGEVRGNYCTWNPLSVLTATANSLGLYNGNLYSESIITWATFAIPSSGKWYWEMTFTGSGSSGVVGIAEFDATYTDYFTSGNAVRGIGYMGNGQKVINGTNTSYNAAYGNDTIGVAVNMDANSITFYKNGVSQGSISNISSYFTRPFFPSTGSYTWSKSPGGDANFGQRPFLYPVSGFKALCDTNLPAPVVAKPNTVMDVLLWSGDSTKPRTFSGLNFDPDLIWVKARSDSYNHWLQDSVRGFTTGKKLRPNGTDAEGTGEALDIYGYVSGSSSTGFTIDGTGTTSQLGQSNLSGQTYVGWTWDAGSSTATNTQGSITSQVRTNGYLSIVSYTAAYTGSARTVGHGLGVKPSLIILKNRSDGSANWRVYHSASGASLPLILNSTAAAASNFGIWDNTEPTSSVFTVGINTDVGGNIGSGDNLIAYCFAPVAGYSAMGSFVGNGSTDGVFVYTGHRSRWLMIKRTDTTSQWSIWDTARNPYNVSGTNLWADSSEVEVTSVNYNADFLSNGFKMRTDSPARNGSGGTYIYISFAESPFAYSRAR